MHRRIILGQAPNFAPSPQTESERTIRGQLNRCERFMAQLLDKSGVNPPGVTLSIEFVHIGFFLQDSVPVVVCTVDETNPEAVAYLVSLQFHKFDRWSETVTSR